MNTTPQQGRKGIIAALIFGGFFVGIVGGGFLARVFWVDKSDGLAGGAMVLFYALLFALLTSVAGGIAGKMLARPKARLLAWIVAPLGLAIMILLGWQITAQQRAAKAAVEAGYTSLLPYEVHVSGYSNIQRFSYVYVDNEADASVGNRPCSGPLPGPSRLALLTALRGIEGRSIHCADCDDESAKLTWQIREAQGEINDGEVYVSEKVMTDHPAVRNLLEAVVEASAKLECE